MERIIVIALIWLGAWIVVKLRGWAYRLQTRGWIPLTPETVWMSHAGHRLVFPPAAWPVYAVAVVATVVVIILQ